ncbi:MAG: protoheme IX farnesyltransferase [Chitinivibrionales bacterium]|nr:protoheme IX farnesyltransferase [Chitinivibrionales bacterium]
MNTNYHILLLKLVRFKLSLAIAFSGLVGAVLYTHAFSQRALVAFAGLFLLSCAAAAVNQLQERAFDLRMDRTKERPLPSNLIRPPYALLNGIILGLAGFFVLLYGTTPTASLLGIINLLWYNAVYTPLKRKTRFALFIGAFTGAMPPLIGWSAAGGNILSPFILSIALFMYLWQIPHFMLLLLKFGDEYESAGFPCLLSSASENKIRGIVFIWFLLTSLSTFVFPLSNSVSRVPVITFLILLNCALIFYFYQSLFQKKRPFNFKAAFRSAYIYQAAILVLLIGNCFVFAD